MCPNFSIHHPIAGSADPGASRLTRLARAYPPLESEVRELVPTDCAAFHLNRRPQTLREWASTERGLLRPVRIGARLGWRTSDLRRLLCAGN
jgi:hypothetical protein